MKCADYYRELHRQEGRVLEAACVSADFHLQGDAHQFLHELDDWIASLKERPEVRVLKKAALEYQSALLLVAVGHFRSAFFGLRSTLELGLTTIDHSARLISHRQWLIGERDIQWAHLVDTENGVLSKPFCKCFFGELADEITHLNGLARTVYRNCSEYVHGNPTQDVLLPLLLEFSADVFVRWHDLAKSVRYTIFFALAMRYLLEMDAASLEKLEPSLVDQLGHLVPIQQFLASPRAV